MESTDPRDDVASDELVPGELSYDFRADRSGYVTHIDDQLVSGVARRAGAPHDKNAGIYLEATVEDGVAPGDVLFTVHADRDEKLEEAREFAESQRPVRVGDRGESLIERV